MVLSKAELRCGWIAPVSGRATFTTRGSNFDTVIAVYQGETLRELTKIADDDSGGDQIGKPAGWHSMSQPERLIASQ